MSAFARGKGKKKSVYVPLRSGGLKQRSTGTSNPMIVRGIERLLAELKDDQRWTLLEAVTAETPRGVKPRATLLDLYHAKASNTLDQLEARLSSVLLKDLRAAWLASVAARLGGEEGTHSSVNNYATQVDTFLEIHPDATAADITPASVLTWLASRTDASTGTKRKYLYAIKSLVAYLLETQLLKTDPLAGFKAPKKNKRRERWETLQNDEAIVRSAIAKYRAYFAFVKATGCDTSAARDVLPRDIHLDRRRTRIPGTKSRNRLVHEAEIEAWAIPYLEEYLRDKLPNTPLWQDITNSGAGHHHTRCCEAVGVEDYTLKDARHSVAVRMRFAGRSFEEIAEQLGNSPAVCADIYARFKPQEAAERLRAVK